MKVLIAFLIWMAGIFLLQDAYAQISYFDGKFKFVNYTYMEHSFDLYDFSKDGSGIKTKYFAQNAYSQYMQWKGSRQILLVTAGAFSDSFAYDGKPVGICVENGRIVNRMIKNEWDAMVLVYDSPTIPSDIVVVDMAKTKVRVKSLAGDDKYIIYDVKNNYYDRLNFLKWGEQANITFFQTQLLYSCDKPYNFNFDNPLYGPSRERRFLTICKKGNIIHHVIVDIKDLVKLNQATGWVKYILEYAGYTVSYIMNLDTGDKNVLHVYKGYGLLDTNPYRGTARNKPTLFNATNLLIYYKDI